MDTKNTSGEKHPAYNVERKKTDENIVRSCNTRAMRLSASDIEDSVLRGVLDGL